MEERRSNRLIDDSNRGKPSSVSHVFDLQSRRELQCVRRPRLIQGVTTGRFPVVTFFVTLRVTGPLAASSHDGERYLRQCGACGPFGGPRKGRWRPPFLTATAVPAPFGFRALTLASGSRHRPFPVPGYRCHVVTPVIPQGHQSSRTRYYRGNTQFQKERRY